LNQQLISIGIVFFNLRKLRIALSPELAAFSSVLSAFSPELSVFSSVLSAFSLEPSAFSYFPSQLLFFRLMQHLKR
jgi:hypothetical protein